MRTWIAIFVLALAAMLLVSNASGTIGNLDSNTFGYLARGVALLIFVGGGGLRPLSRPCRRHISRHRHVGGSRARAHHALFLSPRAVADRRPARRRAKLPVEAAARADDAPPFLRPRELLRLLLSGAASSEEGWQRKK